MSAQDQVDKLLGSFPVTSREKWLEILRKDIGTNDLDTAMWHHHGLTVDPFVHGDDPGAIASTVTFTGRWELAEEFFVDDSTKANSQILEALAGGTETLLVYLTGTPDWRGLFDGVLLDMIKTIIIPQNNVDETELLASFSTFRQSAVSGSSSDTIRLLHSGSRFKRIEVSDSLGTAEGLAEGIQQALMQIESDSKPAEITFIIQTGNTFFYEIARIRSLKILWANALEAIGQKFDSQGTIEVHFRPDAYDKDAHKNMIRASCMALAAVAGGADRLIIRPASGNASSSFERRIARNIHHLMRMESKFDPLPDPVRGSYYIEKLTHQICEQAWRQLQSNIL